MWCFNSVEQLRSDRADGRSLAQCVSTSLRVFQRRAAVQRSRGRPVSSSVCLYVIARVSASSSCAAIARTAGLYLIEPFGLQCQLDIITLLAVLIIRKTQRLPRMYLCAGSAVTKTCDRV